MNIGVIGGSGFIGSHLVEKLVGAGHEVTVFDIMRPHLDEVRHIFLDISDLSRTSIALAGDYDAVYMLAAMSNVNDVHRNPAAASEINIGAVANVLEAAKRNEIRRVILASTVWVYEMSDLPEVDERTPLYLDRVNHVYTGSKVAAELYCHAYQKLYQQDFTILRYGIPYGPRGRRGTVVATFVERVMKNVPLVIFGDGNQYRNFIYVEDLAEGNVTALRDVAKNQTYNLEGQRPVTIREVAETVVKLLSRGDIEYRPARPGDFEGKAVSVKKAKEELGWEARTGIEEGISAYIEWYRKRYSR